MTSRHGKASFLIISIIALLLSCFPFIDVTNEDSPIVHKANHVPVPSDDPNIHDDIGTRYGNIIVEDFKNAEGIDLTNTSAGVDTSRGVVFLGGTEHFPGKLIFTAMDNAHNGNMGGISGADQLVNLNAAQQGYGASRWKAFLSSSGQNSRDIIPEPYASTMPIVDRNEDKLFNNWNDIFDGNSRWQANHYLRTFCNRDVNENTGASPDWYDADGWHGSDTQGRFVNGETCNDWTSTNHGGRATELDGYNVLGQESGSGHPGSQSLAVMAIELPGSMFSGDKTLGHIHSYIFHNQWPTIGAARMTWYENTPQGTSIVYNMTVDDEHWETMENHTNRVFEHQGSKLRWNATMRTNNPDISPAIYKVIIEYDLVSAPEPRAPNSEEWQGTFTPTLEWNFTDPDNGDHQSDYLVEIYSEMEMDALVYNSSWVNSTESKHLVGEALEDGTYYWRVRTRDIYHAPGNFSALKKILIDVTKPVGNITIEGGAETVNEQLVDLEIGASDNGSGVADMQIITDDGKEGPWEEYKTEKRIAISKEDGMKTIGIRFRDHAGIVSDRYNDTIYYDLLGPLGIRVTSETHPDPSMYYNCTNPTFRWEPPAEITGIKGYSYMVDSSPMTEPGKVLYRPNGEITSTAPGEFTGFGNGEWYFHITSCDTYDQWGNTSHFQFNIDTTMPCITDLSPDRDKWHDATDIHADAAFQDIDGFGLDVTSIRYSIRLKGGSFSDWTAQGIELDIVERGIGNNPVKASASVDFTVKEGDGNAIRWQVTDLAGNGPVLSEIIHIKVDQTPVSFSDPLPGDEEISLETSVCCGITVSDTGSGVDARTIEYSISRKGSGEEHFIDWISVNNNIVMDSVTVLMDIEFEPGRDNYIRWRAMDAVGNGYAMSEPSNVWVNSPPLPVIDSPGDGALENEGVGIHLSAEGSADHEEEELHFYWVIKNRTTKAVVFTSSGPDITAVLNESGLHIVTLFVDDGFGFNESAKVDIEILPKKKDPGGNTPGPEDPDSTFSGKSSIWDWWWLMALIAVLIFLFTVIGIVIARRKRKAEGEAGLPKPVSNMARPYSMGGPNFHRPAYSEMAQPGQTGFYPQRSAGSGAFRGGGVPASGVPQGTISAQQVINRAALPMYSETHYASRSQHAVPLISESPYRDVSGGAPSQLPATSSVEPQYSLPSFTTPEGDQNLNLMALPPGMEESPSTDLDVMPISTPTTTSAPVPLNIPGPIPPDVPGPEIQEPQAPPPTIAPGGLSGEILAAPSVPPKTPLAGMENDFLDEIFGAKTPGLIPGPTENSVSEPPAAPPPEPSHPHFQTFQCHQCNTMNPVTSGIRPAIVTCASCGAKGYLE